jgi:hypothetical protein
MHEAFHHKLESAAIRLELIAQTCLYTRYDRNVYEFLQRNAPNDLLEEALATAWMVRDTQVTGGGGHVRPRYIVLDDVADAVGTFLQAWVPNLPAGLPTRAGCGGGLRTPPV